MRQCVLNRITVTASAPVRVFEVLEYKGYIGIANNALALEVAIVNCEPVSNSHFMIYNSVHVRSLH